MASTSATVAPHGPSALVRFYLDSDAPCVVKNFRKNPLSIKQVKYSLLASVGCAVPIEYKPPQGRRAYYMECLRLWKEKGFSVPEIVESPADTADSGPSLCLQYIPGETLKEFLASGAISLERKLEITRTVFARMRKRHCLALFEGDHRLIQFDSNSRNIIIRDGQPVYFDFEMGRTTESIDHSACREVKKLALEITDQLPGSPLHDIVGILFSEYGIIHILRQMADDELDRPFFEYHLRRDAKRKLRRRKLVSKIDLARALRDRLAVPPPRKPASPDSVDKPTLQAAEASSWDGKFYQSLHDGDTRGRDMVHRYAVMDTPPDFTGKSVLDLGCNMGRICLDAKKLGAARAVGVDHRPDVMTAMTEYATRNGIDVEFKAFDINGGVETLSGVIGPAKFDYVFALSIWSHVEQQKLWDIINAYCQDVCYFEDNYPSRVKSLEAIEATLRANLRFSKIEFLGFTTDRGARAVYRLTR